MHGLTVGIAVITVLLVGCADTSGDGGTSPPDVTTTLENTGEPMPEPTDDESPQTRQGLPSIEIASLPIGGSASENCNRVSWLGGDIPEGVTITLGEPRFDPGGIFEVDQSGCPDNPQRCERLEWTTDDQPQCYVGFRQVADEGSVTLVIPAVATCETQSACDSLKGLGGSEIDLTAEPGGTPPETPPETPAETPGETPTS